MSTLLVPHRAGKSYPASMIARARALLYASARRTVSAVRALTRTAERSGRDPRRASAPQARGPRAHVLRAARRTGGSGLASPLSGPVLGRSACAAAAII